LQLQLLLVRAGTGWLAPLCACAAAFWLLASFGRAPPANADSGVNVTVCLTARHLHPKGKEQNNLGAGLEYFRTLPQRAWGAFTPYLAAGAAYCRDSYETAADGRRIASDLPNRVYLHGDAGVEFKPLDAVKIGVAARLGAANYRAAGRMMDLPHAGDFVVVPVPDLRLSLEPQALGVEENTIASLVLKRMSLDVTPAVDPRNGGRGFVAFALDWSIPLD
jgi:hypothetical protein